MNLGVAQEGLKRPRGMGVGHVLAASMSPDDLGGMIRAWSAAAADMRMDGGQMPVMSSAGSGNHGLTAIIPPAIAAKAFKKSNRELAEALALSHLMTGAIKARTGRLTPVCGCARRRGRSCRCGYAFGWWFNETQAGELRCRLCFRRSWAWFVTTAQNHPVRAG